MESDIISVKGAKEHNLKNVDIDIPKNQFVVVTGLSGSGKSSLAFDTIYAEGQRRYVESLSAYARQFLQLQDKPDVEHITGLSPAIAIEQKTTSKNPRSTVGTVTEIYDYMRLLWARIGIAYSPATGLPIESQTVSQMVDKIMELPEGAKILLLAPIVRGQKGEHKKDIQQIIKSGFQRLMIDKISYTVDELPTLDKNKKHDIEIIVDRIVVKEGIEQRLAESIETSLRNGHGLMFAEFSEDAGEHKKEERLTFSEHLSCPVSGFSISEIEPRLFSFNSPYGACPSCDGLGTEIFFDPALVVPDKKKSLYEGAIAPWASATSRFYKQTLDGICKHYQTSVHKEWNELPEEVREVVLYGSGDEQIQFSYDDNARVQNVKKTFEGVIPNLQRRWKENQAENSTRDTMNRYQNLKLCSVCEGYRLKPEAQAIKVGEKHIGEITQLSIDEAVEWFGNLKSKLSEKDNKIAERVLKEIRERLGFLQNVGLDYLTLSRKAGTLSGGESQRIRLASQIGSGLSGVLYVLDEPSIGLHQCDNDKLLETLKNLRDLGNTVMVVEHDEETMKQADHLIDIGPGAGVHGGEIVAQGTPEEVANNKNSITGQYLRGEKFIPVPKEHRKGSKIKKIQIFNARSNNLQNVDCSIPLGTFTCVTGVSGGGKSTLIIQTLYRAAIKMLNGTKTNPGKFDKITGLEFIDKIIEIDQSPIGRTPRSNPATYTGAFNHIRDWFTELPESKARGYKPGRFSFNVKGGRCEACQGDGMIKIEMHFLPDVYVKCEECHGQRYNRETLEVKYKDKSISDVLNMTVEDALGFFTNHPQIKDKLEALNEVGLSYIKIGQSATTLSGGEAQRIKLAKELSRKSTGRTLYILDEPTTGLHTDDIAKLLRVLHKLVDSGNTCLVIEHNMDVIKTADYIIDIGPGGGHKGGKVVATGTPQEVAKVKESITGQYLDKVIKNTPKEKSPKAA